jgi:hypothetical protein
MPFFPSSYFIAFTSSAEKSPERLFARVGSVPLLQLDGGFFDLAGELVVSFRC